MLAYAGVRCDLLLVKFSCAASHGATGSSFGIAKRPLLDTDHSLVLGLPFSESQKTVLVQNVVQILLLYSTDGATAGWSADTRLLRMPKTKNQFSIQDEW